MTLSKAYTDYAVTIHAKTAQAGGAVSCDGVSEVGLSHDPALAVEAADGSPYGSFGALVGGGARLRWTTSDLKALLDAVGLAGLLIDSDGSHPGIVAYGQKYAEGGTRATGSVHLSATIGAGIAVPRSLELPQQGFARVTAEAIATSPTGIAPVAFSEVAALPTGVYPTVAVAWGLGKVMLNATQLSGITGVSIDFGIDVFAEAKDGDLYPSFASIRRIQPTITLATLHAEQVEQIVTHTLDYYAATQVVIYARKRAEGGLFVADATAEHIKI
ncbi:MAG: hypothetical protein IMZ66_08905, partial [Planctomycetes bacterium]|nr:hypothetical protein [Planctomycetota bacterium]